MADLTVLSSTPSSFYTHAPSGSSPAFSGASSSTSALPFSAPRFSNQSVQNLAGSSRRHSSTNAAASTSRLTLDTSSPSRDARRNTNSGSSPTTPTAQGAVPVIPALPQPGKAQQPAPIHARSHGPSQSDETMSAISTSPTSHLAPPRDFRRAQQPSMRHVRKRSMSAPPKPSPIPFEVQNGDSGPGDDNPILYNDQFGTLWKRRPAKRTVTEHGGLGLGHTGMGIYAGGDMRELNPPPPPLLRPTTFWRHTPRSGVSGASYSPSSHLVRRSTFIAAGLTYDRPGHDLSALCVESRLGKSRVVVKPGEQLMISMSSG